MKKLTARRFVLALGALSYSIAAFGGIVDESDQLVVVDPSATGLSFLSTTASPGQKLTLRTDGAVSASEGTIDFIGDRQWQWIAPEDFVKAVLTIASGEEKQTLNVFALRPWDPDEKSIGEFKIGQYAAKPFKGLHTYQRPTGFVPVNEQTEHMLVSPNFRLSHFKCKQQPRLSDAYVMFTLPLLVKLEKLLAVVRENHGQNAQLHVMSGFRTPWYNRLIGNRTSRSRHLFGDAADVFVDTDGDGRMDDLTGDGQSDLKDAIHLAQLAKIALGRDPTMWKAGGLAVYQANAAHGPFIHIDARGYKARWGKSAD